MSNDSGDAATETLAVWPTRLRAGLVLRWGRLHAFGRSPGARRLLASTIWSAAAEALSRGLLMVAMVLVARRLGRATYGEFGIVRSTVNVFGVVGGMGLGLTANRYVSQYRDRDKAFSGHIVGSSYVVALVAGLVVALAVLVGAEPIARGLLRAPQLVGALRLTAPLLLLGAIVGAQAGILQGLEAYHRLAIASLAQGVVAIVALVAGARLFALDGAVAGLLAYTLAGAVFFEVQIRRELRRQEIPVSYGNVAAALPIFRQFSLPVMLAGVAIAPLKWLAETMLVRRVGFAELGVFHAAMTIATMLIALVSTANAPILSRAANAVGASGEQAMRYVSLYGSWYAFLLVATPLALFPRVTQPIFGAAYASSEFLTVNLLLLLYCGLLMYYQGVLRLVALKGSMWFGLYTNIYEGLAGIAGFYLLAAHGATGLALAYVASYVVRTAVSIPYLLRNRIVARAELFDRYFLISLALFTALVVARVRSLQ